jgi:hypothetical protein
LSGYDLPGAGRPVHSEESCKHMCWETENCTAVVHKKLPSRECWMKNYPEKVQWSPLVENPDSDSFQICLRTKSFNGQWRSRSTLLLPLILLLIIAALGLFLIIILRLIMMCVRKRRVARQARAGRPGGSSGTAPDALHRGSQKARAPSRAAEHNTYSCRKAPSQVRYTHDSTI